MNIFPAASLLRVNIQRVKCSIDMHVKYDFYNFVHRELFRDYKRIRQNDVITKYVCIISLNGTKNSS